MTARDLRAGDRVSVAGKPGTVACTYGGDKRPRSVGVSLDSGAFAICRADDCAIDNSRDFPLTGGAA